MAPFRLPGGFVALLLLGVLLPWQQPGVHAG